jgi:HEAT repeat protein
MTPAHARKTLGLAMIAVGLFALSPPSRRALDVFASASILPAFPGTVAAAQNPAAPGDLPLVQNAKIETRAVSGNLESAIQEVAGRSQQPVWMAYAVNAVPGRRSACCGNYSDDDRLCGVCRLEHESSAVTQDSGGSRKTVHLEQDGRLIVLLRAEARQVNNIRVASEDCVLDAGGLPFVWLTGVQAPDSVALLSKYVTSGEFSEHRHDHLGNGALTAIALHGDPAADRAMESFVAPSQDERLRRQAAFWLGAARGKSGLAQLERMAKSDPSPQVRAHVAFGFHVSKEPGAVDDMIRMAHDDSSAHVRGQALFWLGQKAGQKAASTIQGAIENDPDTEVKKKAVFALSQLPKDEGVPKLIEVAQTNRNPEVRKQAMFWLGQSHDPRALDFFEKILSR